MFVVTNREIVTGAKGLKLFGDRPNLLGPNELRLFTAKLVNKKWKIKLLDDEADDATKKKLGIDPTKTIYASYVAAREVFNAARKNKKHILFFVHGFNNDMDDILTRAQAFADRFDVEVVPFSWPANGGGIKGVASYKADKRDARVSAGALDRTLTKMGDYLRQFTEEAQTEMWQKAAKKHPDNPQMRDALFTELCDKDCPFTVNMLLHSMGNYLYKQLLQSSVSEGTGLLFDNVILAAADTNNDAHAAWIEKIRCRKRIFITINEDDNALLAARAKAGQEQMARLGHHLFGLDATRGVYVNFTDASYVRSSHAYFEGTPVARNKAVRDFFKDAFAGKAAESNLRYRADRNFYEFK